MHGIVLFDGECNFCNRWVKLIFRFDKQGFFQFAPMQSDVGQDLINRFGPTNPRWPDLPDSVILIWNGQLFTESRAALSIVRNLSLVWPLYYPLSIVPGTILDWAYRKIAASRYQLFGRSNQCQPPSLEFRKRFLTLNTKS